MQHASCGIRPITSSADWSRHFLNNAARQRAVPWELGADVTPAELAEIGASLRAWQLGESSDGAHLYATARDYATRVRDPDFLEAVRWFIAEEQRHGNMLGKFLDLAGIERARWNWGDAIFRLLRYAAPRMEVWATPVVMVETHAIVYFNAIRRATGSRVLRAVCEQILADETAHIRFQCERLAVLHRERSKPLRRMTSALHVLLFTAITVAVWAGHRRALRAGGCVFRIFWRAAWSKMRFAWRIMDPNRYSWNDEPAPIASLFSPRNLSPSSCDVEPSRDNAASSHRGPAGNRGAVSASRVEEGAQLQ